MTESKTTAKDTCGFTFIELLVVLAITLLLAAILLTASTSAARNGHSVASAATRRFGLATTPYADDYTFSRETNFMAKASSAIQPSGAAVSKTPGGYQQVSFDQLSSFESVISYNIVNSNTPAFYYAPRLDTEIPANIKALNGKEVVIKGFMLPLKGEAGRVQEFLLLKNQSLCCFGKPPKVNECIHVRVKGKGLKPLMDQVLTIYGTLQVGEYSENRHTLGIYRLNGDGMDIPRQF